MEYNAVKFLFGWIRAWQVSTDTDKRTVKITSVYVIPRKWPYKSSILRLFVAFKCDSSITNFCIYIFHFPVKHLTSCRCLGRLQNVGYTGLTSICCLTGLYIWTINSPPQKKKKKKNMKRKKKRMKRKKTLAQTHCTNRKPEHRHMTNDYNKSTGKVQSKTVFYEKGVIR